MTIRIVFMGSPDFSVPVLRALAVWDGSVRDGSETHPEQYIVVGVVTQPDRPAGRHMTLTPPPVKVAADELHIPVIQPLKLREPGAVQQLRDWNPDLIVVAAFGQILRPEVLDLPKYGCVNVHASLLPRHRGAAPIQAAILAGDAETGITIMKMDPGLDTGPMLRQRAIPIGPQDTGASMFEKLSQLSGQLLLETLPDYLSGKLLPQPQPETGSTYASMLKKEHGLLDFTRPAVELERKVRAFSPWPGTFMLLEDGAPLKIHKVHIVAAKSEPGKRMVVNGLPAVGAADGLIVFDELQPAGKKSMPGKAFLAGGRAW
jgi:methionyl-tRNA formyltransferase